MKALIQANCNLDVTTHLGQTALHLAVLQQKYHLAELLIRSGCNLNIRDKLGHRTLFSLARAGERRCSELVVRAGINLRQEAWLMEDDLSENMEVKDKNLYQWLREQAHGVPTLMHTCRMSVRVHLGRHADKLITQLALPQMLQRYLSLEI